MIRRQRTIHNDKNMKNAIWATYYHYSSTDEIPNHEMCPKGEDSWCSYQRAEANGEIDSYNHEYPSLPPDVLTDIKPIYEVLSSDNLLLRWVGGFNQNHNESYNQLVWKISPKTLNSSSIIVEISANIAACILNDVMQRLLIIANAMEISCGPNAHRYAEKIDMGRIQLADQRATLKKVE